mgnify:CR=1 FL=1
MANRDRDLQPVVIGAGRRTQKDGSGEKSLRDLIAAAVKTAVAAATHGLPPSASASLVGKIDNVGCPGTFLDEMCQRVGSESPYPNLPAAVARAVGASVSVDGCLTTGPSGNTPQAFVNHFAEKIAAAQLLERNIVPLVQRGLVKPCVHAVLPLEKVGEAHTRAAANEGIGKFVLQVS